ncbi:hypothetical protein AGR1C_pAt40267 [Agrobacterium fabacearum TT111]|nr:hypothetical protein AGR1C_pAt40267 [Agrobacterium fabacearum TT111]
MTAVNDGSSSHTPQAHVSKLASGLIRQPVGSAHPQVSGRLQQCDCFGERCGSFAIRDPLIVVLQS